MAGMQRNVIFLYGLACYASFLVTFAYLVGFVGNMVVPRSLDEGPPTPLGPAIAIDLALLALFGLQHSIMARPSFKAWWTRFVPPAIERSTYVLVTSLVLALLFWQWRPIPAVVWEIGSPLGRVAMSSLYLCGCLLVVVATVLINHADLFGLRQVWGHLRRHRYRPPGFVTPGPYRMIRHPLYLGWIIAFWATPKMTVAHLLFAVGLTAYILVAIRFEERDLVTEHGEKYAGYRRRVPMLVPFLARAK